MCAKNLDVKISNGGEGQTSLGELAPDINYRKKIKFVSNKP